MITRHEAPMDRTDIWSALAAALPEPVTVDAVLARLDTVVAGEHDFTLDLLDGRGPVTFKARLQILGVIREDVGTGASYRAAADEAFLAVASKFRIGAHATVRGAAGETVTAPHAATAPSRIDATPEPATRAPEAERAHVAPVASAATDEIPDCPKCGGRVWDNRLSKRNPKAPDFKCRDRSCDGVIWPPRDGQGSRAAKPADAPRPVTAGAPLPGEDDLGGPLADEDDDLPF